MSDISPILRGCRTNLTGWHLVESIGGLERCRCGWMPNEEQRKALAAFSDEVTRRDQRSADRLAKRRTAPPRMDL